MDAVNTEGPLAVRGKKRPPGHVRGGRSPPDLVYTEWLKSRCSKEASRLDRQPPLLTLRALPSTPTCIPAQSMSIYRLCFIPLCFAPSAPRFNPHSHSHNLHSLCDERENACYSGAIHTYNVNHIHLRTQPAPHSSPSVTAPATMMLGEIWQEHVRLLSTLHLLHSNPLGPGERTPRCGNGSQTSIFSARAQIRTPRHTITLVTRDFASAALDDTTHGDRVHDHSVQVRYLPSTPSHPPGHRYVHLRLRVRIRMLMVITVRLGTRIEARGAYLHACPHSTDSAHGR